jgi:hypothetical protein
VQRTREDDGAEKKKKKDGQFGRGERRNELRPQDAIPSLQPSKTAEALSSNANLSGDSNPTVLRSTGVGWAKNVQSTKSHQSRYIRMHRYGWIDLDPMAS